MVGRITKKKQNMIETGDKWASRAGFWSPNGGSHSAGSSTGGVDLRFEADVRHKGVEARIRQRQQLCELSPASAAVSSGVLRLGFRGRFIGAFLELVGVAVLTTSSN